MKELEDLIVPNFPYLLNAWKAALATVACGVIGNPYRCLALIFTGQPSSGKSTVIESFYAPDPTVAYSDYFFRSDKFTTASFVTHSTSAKDEEQLKKIDLLPKLRNRTLLTSELAEMFKGKKEELIPKFNILTRVLDGQGLTTDSGAWGKRGETGDNVFQWVGGTTPLEPAIITAMATLGPRLVFYFVDRPEQTARDLVAKFKSNQGKTAQKDVYNAVRNLVGAVYQTYGRRTDSEATGVDRDSIQIINKNEELFVMMMQWAEIAAKLRMTIHEAKGDSNNMCDEDPGDRLSMKRKEFADRIAESFTQFAIGSAIIHGRNYFTEYDVKQIAHIALSTGMPGRTPIFEQALRRKGQISITTAREYVDFKRNGIELRYIRELELAGLGDVILGESHTPSVFVVDEDFAELGNYLHAEIANPKKRRKVKHAVHTAERETVVVGPDDPVVLK
jgi:hypothetical protein